MDNVTDVVRTYYDENVEKEWARLKKERLEYDINMHFLSRYIQPGDTLLDIGGGPGRYSLAFSERGVNVTLCDLSPENVAFAKAQAEAAGLSLRAFAGDAREIASLTDEMYDHVLLMGPIYHLLTAEDRAAAMAAALSRLKVGGTIAVAYINSYAGMIYDMREMPEMLLNPQDQEYFAGLAKGLGYAGDGFTKVAFEPYRNVLPFMEQFGLEKLHFLSSESMFAPCSDRLYALEEPLYREWLKQGIRLCELPDALPYAEHLLYIGRKKEK